MACATANDTIISFGGKGGVRSEPYGLLLRNFAREKEKV
jgi:hypothetical protein